jgi:uroporphyrinogen-III decarboxylase
MMKKQWTQLTPEERREERFAKWLDTSGIEFDSSEAEKAYKTRIKRLADTLLMKIPDRVPVTLPVDTFPALYAGTDFHTVMYDYDELYRAWKKFLMDFDMDSVVSPGAVYPGKVFDIVDYKLYAWPGHGLPLDATGHQFVEGEYMMADEYDALLTDPSDFTMRVYVPRTVGALAGFTKLPPLTALLGKPQFLLPVTAHPDVQAAFQALIDAGKERARYQKVIMKFGREAQAAGFPGMRGAVSFAPFDTLSDALRGTKGVIMDMYRQPDNVLKAVDMIADFNIRNTVEAVNASGGIMVMFPLHKGDDTFMSNDQFEKFYWPSLRKVIKGLINEGIMVMLFAEGKYNNRLEQVNDIPGGWILWHFDQTDMTRAKEVLGNQCLTGNVPTSLMCTGTPEAVKECCRELIEVCGRGGGYILNAGAGSAQVKEENLRAMMDAAKEYGVY